MSHSSRKRERRMTRREFVGGALAAAGVVTGRAGVAARPESEQQAEHRVHRLRRPRQREPQRAHHHAGRAGGGRGRGGAPDPHAGPHPDENVIVLCDVNQNALDAASAALPEGQDVSTTSGSVFDSPNDFDAVVVVDRRAHARVRDLPGADARQARLLREAAHLQHLGSAAHPRDRREVPEAVDADGQPGPRLADAAHDQGNPQDRRHRSGARSPRLGRPRVGTAGCGVRREVRQAARLLQRHPDRRPVQGRDAGPADTTTSICGSGRRRRGRSTRRTSPARAGTAGGISATAR